MPHCKVFHAPGNNCSQGTDIEDTGDYQLDLAVENALVAYVGTAFGGSAWDGQAQNVTVDHCTTLADDSSFTYYDFDLYNCVLANVSYLDDCSMYVDGQNNGFYNSPTSDDCTSFWGPTFVTGTSPFQTGGNGNYYLAENSNFRSMGTTNGFIDRTLLASLKIKTTHAPIALPALMSISGDLTLFPQVSRYTSGAPDLGYYYPALDYTVANVTLAGGNITVEPGTAIATRNEYLSSQNTWTIVGFVVEQGSSFVSHGLPTSPITFTSTKMVQEQPETDFTQYQKANSIPFSSASFVPDYYPDDANSPAPTLDFRFSNFYLPGQDYHIFSGWTEDQSGYISLDSSAYISFRDSSLYGGEINVGLPYYTFGTDEYKDYVWAPGAISWFNNLFDRVDINLNPTFYWYNGVINCDMQLEAYNNLFHGSNSLILEPFPATDGNWLFEDNLFDKTRFYQDTQMPLDYDYNGYWPLTTAELIGNGDAAELSPNTSSDGLSGANDKTLTAAPPYQTGPLGNYYLPTTTLLYNGGSRSVADAGLSQYTTQANQTKDTSQVDIGLHYVATTSSTSATPKDTDGDGVADYVEDLNGNGTYEAGTETDWQTAMTDGSTPDSLSVIYDDIDLSGDGLVGRVKKALGITPFDTSNPLKLSQVTSAGPESVLFELPINYSFLSGVATVELGLGGELGPELQGMTENASDGNTLLVWNSTFDSPGQHYLQPRLILKNVDWNSDQPVTMGTGPLLPFQSDNEVQFERIFSHYDSSGATLYAQSSPGVAYSIALTDPNGNPLNNFTGNADANGVIDVPWYFLENDGQTYYAGDSFNAAFAIGDPDTYTETLSHSALGYGDGDFVVAYGWMDASLCGKPNDIDMMIENGIVEPLWDASNGHPYDSAGFNVNQQDDPNGSYGDAGYVAGSGAQDGPKQTHTVSGLMASLSSTTGYHDGKYSRNFYWFGHGTEDKLMNGLSGDSGVVINASDVGGPSSLGNYGEIVNGGIGTDPVLVDHLDHPYRFVFIDGCETANAVHWPSAFGIPAYEWSKDFAKLHADKASAYVGFTGIVYSFGGVNGSCWACRSYDYTLKAFFTMWQQNKSLQNCMAVCSHPDTLWAYFAQEGVQDDFNAFPYGINSVMPIGRPRDKAGNSYNYGALTRYYGTRYLIRTGVEQ